ncbi:MAG: hypothetical protein RLZZ383_2083 [Pseudomonadota bacterium]
MPTSEDVSAWIRVGHMVRCGLPAPFIVLHHHACLGVLWTRTSGGAVALEEGVPRRWRIGTRRWRPLLDRPNGEAVALALGYGFALSLIGGGVDPFAGGGPLPLWASMLEARAALRREERAVLASWGAFAARPVGVENRVGGPATSV